MKFRIRSLKMFLFLLPCFSYAEEIVVDATTFPNAEILEATKPILAKKGYELKINHYTSYNDPSIIMPRLNNLGSKNNPNTELVNKHCDANFFQHLPYLNQYNMVFKSDLVSAGGVFYVPFALYLNKTRTAIFKKTHDLSQALKGARIAIPDNSINETRAIKMLANNKILGFNQKNSTPGLDDVESNTYGVIIYKVDSAVMPQVLNNADAVVMNVANAEISGIHLNQATLIESSPIEYANILVSRKDNVNSAKIKALNQALHSKEVQTFIQNKYGNLVIPVF